MPATNLVRESGQVFPRRQTFQDAKFRQGKAVASASYYLIGADDGGLWPWRKRWPEPGDRVSGDRLDAFFGKNAAQHEATIKKEAHICKYYGIMLEI